MSGSPFYSTNGTEIDILGIKPAGASVSVDEAIPAGMHGSAYVQESTGAAVTVSANAGGKSIVAFNVGLSGITAADIVTTYTPGFAFKILKLDFVTIVAATTAAKAASVTAKIGSTATTGGVVALTSANCTPKGNVVAGSAITAANVGTSTDTISLTASSVTAFVEGSGEFLLVLQDTETAALVTKVIAIDSALVNKGIVNNDV